jgi:SAM-dependent methyltransferase
VDLRAIIDRPPPPLWGTNSKIPWHEDAFSERMLREHLDQTHDRASRRFSVIDNHVAWVLDQVAPQASCRVLDVACGPGLYSERLARLGHRCVGIDISPASIAHARATAAAEVLPCAYVRGDLRHVPLGGPFDLALFLFGEFNSFPARDAQRLLRRIRDTLGGEGALVLEAHTPEYVEQLGRQTATWFRAQHSVFADHPHLWLKEAFWYADEHASIERYFVLCDHTDPVEYLSTAQAFDHEQYETMFFEAGFRDVDTYPSFAGNADENFFLFVARV